MMNIIRTITNNQPAKLAGLVVWNCIQGILKGIPYGLMMLVVIKLFEPIMNPDMSLDISALWKICAGFILVLVLQYIVFYQNYNKSSKSAFDTTAQGRLDMGEHLRKLPMSYFKEHDPGDITALILQDYTNVERYLYQLLPNFIGAVVTPFVVFCWLFSVDVKMALIASSVILLDIPVVLLLQKLVVNFGDKHMRSKIKASSRMLEYLEGIKIIKSFNMKGDKFKRLDDTFRQLRNDSIKVEGFAGSASTLGGVILSAGLPIIILAGLYFMNAGSLNVSALIIFLILGAVIYEPMISGLIYLSDMNYTGLAAKRIQEALDTDPLPESEKDQPFKNYDIEFKNVTFSYQNIEVLKDISFYLPQGSTTALVGPSGSGKSTITRLISRFWDVDRGNILIGGRDIRDVKSESLMSSISMVFQDVYLFNDSILNNIKVGKKNASFEEVVQAAKAAHCHEFIEAFPDGYDTLVGEGGGTLAGGEKQRISIARAILKDAPVVLLDEATASLDPENEIYIQQAINSLVKNKTLLIIAHRLNTIAQADKILVLEKGEIIQEGTHGKLMSEEDLYSLLWREQQKARGWKFGSVCD